MYLSSDKHSLAHTLPCNVTTIHPMLRDYQKHSYAKDLVYNELLQNFLGQYKYHLMYNTYEMPDKNHKHIVLRAIGPKQRPQCCSLTTAFVKSLQKVKHSGRDLNDKHSINHKPLGPHKTTHLTSHVTKNFYSFFFCGDNVML